LTATDESETTHSGVKKERSEKQESNTFISKVVANFKVLFENLSKSTTLITMILAICVYWSAWGWQFALGFVLGIYVHEIGHVRAMHKLGLGDSAPSFIPGVGAYVQMDHLPVSVRESARVGLAGPIWGLAFSLVVFGIYFLIDYPILGEIARVSAWINLLNLMPLPPFDGGRGFSALSRTGTFLVTILIGAMWYLTRDGLLIALFLTGMLVTTAKSPEAAVTSDRRALLELCILVVALSLLSNIKIPITPIL
jgi:Zn-dependent protease